MPTDDYIDLQAHEKLMTKMQEVVDKADQLIEASQDARDQVSEHNLDVNAHPDIRRELASLDAASNSSVAEAIQQHNESSDAHADLFQAIRDEMADTSDAAALIQEAVSEHNSSPQAHSDLRQSLNKLETQVGTVNVSELASAIQNIEDTLGTGDTSLPSNIAESIIELQSVDARHDAEITQNRNDISDINDYLYDTLERDVVYVGNRSAAYEQEADTHHLSAEALRIGTELGYDLFTEDGPNFLNFVCSLPPYVGRGTTKAFTMTGVTSAGGTVTYAITPGGGNITFSKDENIADGESVNVTVGSGAGYHSLCYFTVTATDASTKSTRKVVAFYVTTPINPDNVTLMDLPSAVEPGQAYTFTLRNLVESNNRYTYELDPGSSNILFNESGVLDEGDEVTAAIPSSATRGGTLSFNVIIHDIYGPDTIKTVTLSVNELPGAESFTSNVPRMMAPNTSQTIRFSGITSVDGVAATYAIIEPSEYLTFSKTEGIIANENVTMTLDADALRGSHISFTVKTKDKNNASLEIPLGFQVNTLPSSEDVTCTMVESIDGGKTTTMRISGGSDVEDSTITYTIKDVNSGFTFSRMNSITSSTAVSVTVPKVAAVTQAKFNIYAVDSLGEISAPKTVTVTVNPVYVQVTPSITYPTAGISVPAEFTARISAYNDYVDV